MDRANKRRNPKSEKKSNKKESKFGHALRENFIKIILIVVAVLVVIAVVVAIRSIPPPAIRTFAASDVKPAQGVGSNNINQLQGAIVAKTGDTIWYADNGNNNNLYRLDPGKKPVLIDNQGAKYLNAVGSQLYYVQDGGLDTDQIMTRSVSAPDKTPSAKLASIDGIVSDLLVIDGSVYFGARTTTDQTLGFRKLDIQTGKMKTLTDDVVMEVNYQAGYIYYIGYTKTTALNIMRIKPDGSDPTTILSATSDMAPGGFLVADKTIYVTKMDMSGSSTVDYSNSVYTMGLDGKNLQQFGMPQDGIFSFVAGNTVYYNKDQAVQSASPDSSASSDSSGSSLTLDSSGALTSSDSSDANSAAPVDYYREGLYPAANPEKIAGSLNSGDRINYLDGYVYFMNQAPQFVDTSAAGKAAKSALWRIPDQLGQVTPEVLALG